jgi:hypothetical protein
MTNNEYQNLVYGFSPQIAPGAAGPEPTLSAMITNYYVSSGAHPSDAHNYCMAYLKALHAEFVARAAA